MPDSDGPAATRAFLDAAWQAYRRIYIHPSGYVLDRTRNGGEVTSEGQSYALLRAAWTGDRATFDRVHAWTTRVLQRPDGLHAWRWSPEAGGRILDGNSATDADQDIAFALILAADRFDEPAHLARARRILRAIHLGAGIEVAGGWFPSAGNWAVPERIVNLSYFAPYAYPYFARLDPDADWEGVATVGYALLARATAGGEASLPPDFMVVAPDGQIAALPPDSTLGATFSFDGIRIPWRIEFDCRLHGRAEACASIGGLPALSALLAEEGRLVTAYDTGARALDRGESPSVYAGLLPALDRQRPDLAALVRRTHLGLPSLGAILQRDDRYYDLNWVWFGLALADGWLVERTPAPGRLPAAPTRGP